MPMINIDKRMTVAKPIEILEDIHLDKSNLETFTRIRMSIEEKTKQDLVQFIKKSKDVFAWSHEDMSGINPSVITHRLNISPSYKPVCQKRRVFSLEWDNTIKEVQKLVLAEFVRKVYYLDSLANVVMVKKANGK